MQKIRQFVSDTSGATSIEYGLIGALISIIMIVALTSMGSTMNAKFTAIGTALK